MKILGAGALAFALAACGGGQDAGQAGGAANGTAGAAGTDAIVVLGMTERQLLDADIVDANGNELGEVEGLVRGGDGAVQQLVVEVEDSSPDRYVHVPVSGVEAFDNRGDRDLRTTMTRDQLMALPEVPRP